MADFIPGQDGSFYAWEQNLMTYVTAHLAALGFVIGDIVAAEDAQALYETARAELLPAQSAAQAARAARDAARKNYEAELRKLVRRIQASPLVDDAERAAMGITIPSGAQSVPAPTSRPVAEIESVEGLRHTLRLTDSETGKKARPRGTVVEVRMAVVPHGQPVTANPDELPIVGTNTTSKVVRQFDGADACKTAVYGFRYVNTRGETGPWSTIVSGTIAA